MREIRAPELVVATTATSDDQETIERLGSITLVTRIQQAQSCDSCEVKVRLEQEWKNPTTIIDHYYSPDHEIFHTQMRRCPAMGLSQPWREGVIDGGVARVRVAVNKS